MSTEKTNRSFNSVRIVSDGTSYGTKVYFGGQEIANVRGVSWTCPLWGHASAQLDLVGVEVDVIGWTQRDLWGPLPTAEQVRDHQHGRWLCERDGQIHRLQAIGDTVSISDPDDDLMEADEADRRARWLPVDAKGLPLAHPARAVKPAQVAQDRPTPQKEESWQTMERMPTTPPRTVLLSCSSVALCLSCDGNSDTLPMAGCVTPEKHVQAGHGVDAPAITHPEAG